MLLCVGDMKSSVRLYQAKNNLVEGVEDELMLVR